MLVSPRVLPLLLLAASPVFGSLRGRWLEEAEAAANAHANRKKKGYYSPQNDFLLDDIKRPQIDATIGDLTPKVKDDTRRVLKFLDPKNPLLSHADYANWNRRTAAEPPEVPFPEDDAPEEEEAAADTGGEAAAAAADGGSVVKESKQPPWPFEKSDIPLDPKITYGELENGLRYYALPNDEPPGQMELRLHIDAGANYESDPFDGGAHFLEHMMFQTTQSYPEGDLIESFQRLGLGFGAHINAYTTIDETVYFLGLPNTDNDTIAMSFGWMRDVLDGALLEPEEIELERGVVVSELEIRDSISQRLGRELNAWLLPDNLLSARFVIGTENTIETMDRPLFVDYYEQFYVPRRATFIVVGDMNATDMVDLIEEYFADAADAGDRGEEVDYGPVLTGYGLRANVFVDEEFTSDVLSMETVRPAGPLPDTVDQRIEDMKISIMNGIIGNRFFDIGIPANSTIFSGDSSHSYAYNFVSFTSLTVYPKPDMWREAMYVMEQEFRRIMEYGFTEFEVNEAKANRLNGYEQWVLGEDSLSNGYYAGTLNAAVNGDFVVSTAEEDLRIAKLALDEITPEVLHEIFMELWNTTDINLWLAAGSINGTKEEVSEEMMAIWLDSQTVPVDPPVEEEVVEFAYTDFGEPGTIVEDNFVEDLEIRQMTLSNNVRVNMKQTDFDAGIIRYVARFGIGMLSQPENATFLNSFTSSVFQNGGLGNHTIFDIDSATTGKTVGFSFGISQGSFAMAGGTNQDDIELALQLMTAYFVDPAYREEAAGWWRDGIPNYLDGLNRTLGSAYNYGMYAYLLGGDGRFSAPTEEILRSYEVDDAKDWLTPFLESAYLEFSIVGDFNETETVDVLLKTIGALPERDNSPPEITEEMRNINIPTPPQTGTYTYESKIPTAGAYVAWEIPSFVDQDIGLLRRMNVLSGVFNDRMRINIREELGGSYAPGAGATMSEDFEYGFFIADSVGVNDEVEIFTEIIMGIAANISTGDITQDEFDRSITPFQSNLADTLRSNSYWLNTVMDYSQARPWQLDWSRGRDQFYEDMKLDEINELAIAYLSPDVAFQFGIYAVNATDTVEVAGDK